MPKIIFVFLVISSLISSCSTLITESVPTELPLETVVEDKVPALSITPTEVEVKTEPSVNENDTWPPPGELSDYAIVSVFSYRTPEFENGSFLLNLETGERYQPSVLKYEDLGVIVGWKRESPNKLYFSNSAIIDLDNGYVQFMDVPSTTYGEYLHNASWSASGQYLIWGLVDRESSNTSVSILDLHTNGVTNFTFDAEVHVSSTSFDDRYFTLEEFWVTRPEDVETSRLWIIERETENIVFETAYDLQIASVWSPADYKLAIVQDFSGYVDDPQVSKRIHIVDIETGEVLSNFDSSSLPAGETESARFSGIDWSEDGNRFVFTNIVSDENKKFTSAEICIIEITTGGIDCITNGVPEIEGKFNFFPEWIDNNRVVFKTQGDDYCYPLAIINDDGSGFRFLTEDLCLSLWEWVTTLQ